MDLNGFLGKVIPDTRRVADPWGFGFEADILRSNHPDWLKVETERINDSPAAERTRVAVSKHSLRELAPAGFRSGRKLTAGESYQKLERAFAEKPDAQTPIETVRNQKPGIAAVLLRGAADGKGGFVPHVTFRGSAIFRRNGLELDLSTVEGRLTLLDHRTWVVPGEGEEAIPVLKADPETGEPELDEAGDPIENLFGGDNVGDALARWLTNYADDLAAFQSAQKATAQGESAAVSNGSIATGSPSPSANAGD